MSKMNRETKTGKSPSVSVRDSKFGIQRRSSLSGIPLQASKSSTNISGQSRASTSSQSSEQDSLASYPLSRNSSVSVAPNRRKTKSTPSTDRLRYSRHSIPETRSARSYEIASLSGYSLSRRESKRTGSEESVKSRTPTPHPGNYSATDKSKAKVIRNSSPSSGNKFRASDKISKAGRSRSLSPAPRYNPLNVNKSPKKAQRAKSSSPKGNRQNQSRNNSSRTNSSRSPSSAGSMASRRSSRSGIQSSDSSTPVSKSSDILLRKALKNGRWYEEKEEIIYTLKTDGKTSKRSQMTQSEINVTQTPDIGDALSRVDPNFLDVERAIQHFPKNMRGIIQDDQEEFGKEILAKVNQYRLQHEAKSVRLSPKLSVYAREWAKYLARNSKIGFSNRHDIGEAIYVKTSSEPWIKISGDDVAEKWYSEVGTHDFENPSEIKAANFTQIVWRATKEIGVALERSQDGMIAYIVVFFHPKGNFPGDIAKQVQPEGGTLRYKRNEKGMLEPQVAEKDESFVSAVVRACNFYRLIHGVVPLVLDKALSVYAQEWADQLALEDRIRARPNNVYGENIYRSTFKINAELHGQEPVEYWYGTRRFYTSKDPADIRAAPFTQLVWSDTRDLGVGFAKSKSDRTYVAAYFNPPGNLVGQFAKQVLPMKWNSTL